MDYNGIIIFALAFAFGWVLREQYAKYRVNKMMSFLETTVTAEVKEKVVRIVIERHSGMFYVYSAEDRSFMAQGVTRQELEDNLAKRYPGKMFGAEPDNLKLLGVK